MLYQRLREQARFFDEVLKITSHDEPPQRFDRDLLNVCAVTGRKHQRPAFQSGVSPQDSNGARVIRCQVSRIRSGHSHSHGWIAKVEYFESGNGVLECHWRTTGSSTKLALSGA